jgi:hypothetical protein
MILKKFIPIQAGYYNVSWKNEHKTEKESQNRNSDAAAETI